MKLNVADHLALPIDYVVKVCAILAQRRKGKTYTASVLAEELVAASQPFVALDPTGAWWGLRASADGKRAGLPVVILGGQHGDLPLETEAGRFVADLVLDHPGYYVLDLSLLGSRGAERQFATDFADRLYRRKMQPGMDFPLHLFVDEADMFVPQDREDKGDVRMLGAFQAIVRRGGLHGLGVTLISQRPALVNKSVLTQLDLLVLLRLVAGNDQDAIEKNYLSRAGTKEQVRDTMDSLSSLALGEAWVWEPGADPPLYERVRIRERHTFNSSATPKPGEKRAEPHRLADVDLVSIKEQMSEAIERAKADDPAELRKLLRLRDREIEQLKRDLADRPDLEPERIEIPFVPEEALAAIDTVDHALASTLGVFKEALSDAREELRRAGEAGPRSHRVERQASSLTVHDSGGRRRDIEERAAQRPGPAPRRKPSGEAVSGSEAPEGLGLAHRRILTVLSQFPGGRTRQQLATLANYHSKSKGFANALSALRTSDLVTREEPITLTPEGWAVISADDFPSTPIVGTGRDLLDFWKDQPKVGKAAGLILDALYAHPGGMTRDELAAECDYHPKSKGFANALSQLRSLGLVVGRETLTLIDELL